MSLRDDAKAQVIDLSTRYLTITPEKAARAILALNATIEADAEHHTDGYWHVTGPGGQTFIPAWAVTDVEPLTEPLPTEPGVRFWGKPQDHPAEWWFVQEFQGVRYMSSGGFCWDEEQAQRNGLVRLPDPEATP